MTIGQLAKKTQIHIQTIRYYESIRLLPKPKTKESGYREFSEEFIDKINFIKNAKAVGFTLSEIMSIIKIDECQDIYELASNKLIEVKIKINKGKELEKKLNLLLKKCPNKGSAEDCTIIKSFKKISMKRKIEIFTAGCPVCEEQVEKIKEAACPSCDVVTLNVSSDKDALSKAKKYNVKSLPAVAIDGKLAECCISRGIDLNVLKSLGLGVAG